LAINRGRSGPTTAKPMTELAPAVARTEPHRVSRSIVLVGLMGAGLQRASACPSSTPTARSRLPPAARSRTSSSATASPPSAPASAA
jgi:hypothetical protein